MVKKSSEHAGSSANDVNANMLGGYWPGIQLYYPPVKYAPALGIYEDLEAASLRMKKYAHVTRAHTLIFDLEDGCRQKEMSRTLLRQELPLFKRRNEVAIAIRVNPFRTEDSLKDVAVAFNDMIGHVQKKLGLIDKDLTDLKGKLEAGDLREIKRSVSEVDKALHSFKF